jgi:hypothetical protein
MARFPGEKGRSGVNLLSSMQRYASDRRRQTPCRRRIFASKCNALGISLSISVCFKTTFFMAPYPFE